MFVEHGAQQEEEGEDEMESHTSYQTKQDRSVVGVDEIKVGENDVSHLKQGSQWECLELCQHFYFFQ